MQHTFGTPAAISPCIRETGAKQNDSCLIPLKTPSLTSCCQLTSLNQPTSPAATTSVNTYILNTNPNIRSSHRSGEGERAPECSGANRFMVRTSMSPGPSPDVAAVREYTVDDEPSGASHWQRTPSSRRQPKTAGDEPQGASRRQTNTAGDEPQRASRRQTKTAGIVPASQNTPAGSECRDATAWHASGTLHLQSQTFLMASFSRR